MQNRNWVRGEAIWEWGFLRLYGITMFLGILISFLSVLYFWRRQKYSLEILQILLIIIVPTSLLGARVWYLIANNAWGSLESFGSFFVGAGLSIHGGVTVSATSAIIFLLTKRSVIDLPTAFGIILPCVLIGQVIGRWGNFSNHEVYGKVVENPETLNWLTFIKPHMFINGEYRQPFFLYESMLNLFAYIVIVWLLLRKNWVKPGTTGALYLIWYGVVRLIMEPLRDPGDIMKINGVQTSVIVSIIWLVIGFSLLIYFELLTMSPKWIKNAIPSALLSSRKYEKIRPVKERKLFWFGPKSNMKKKFLFWGKEIPNAIPIWIVKKDDKKLSKRQINMEATQK